MLSWDHDDKINLILDIKREKEIKYAMRDLSDYTKATLKKHENLICDEIKSDVEVKDNPTVTSLVFPEYNLSSPGAQLDMIPLRNIRSKIKDQFESNIVSYAILSKVHSKMLFNDYVNNRAVIKHYGRIIKARHSGISLDDYRLCKSSHELNLYTHFSGRMTFRVFALSVIPMIAALAYTDDFRFPKAEAWRNSNIYTVVHHVMQIGEVFGSREANNKVRYLLSNHAGRSAMYNGKNRLEKMFNSIVRSRISISGKQQYLLVESIGF